MQTYLKPEQLLHLLQITNSNFPIGSFSHSFGLETYIRNEEITNLISLEKWIKNFLYNNFTCMDLLAIKHSYELLKENQDEKIFELDQIISCSGLSKETRTGTIRIGTQMLKIFLELFNEIKLFKQYQDKIKNKECFGHPAIVFSILCFELKINLDDCLYAYTYSTISNLIQNCVRAIPLGQIEGQKLIFKVKQSFSDVFTKMNVLDFDKNFCKNFPGFEIKQMNHENIHVRLFMS